MLNNNRFAHTFFVASTRAFAESNVQRWSRGHKARGQGQGHKKNPRPRTAFPKTDPLEAKDQGHSRKCSPKEKGLQKSFSGNLQFVGVARIFD